MIAKQLYAHVTETAREADGDALAMARLCLLDWLGCALAGANEAVVNGLVATVDPVEPSHSYALVGRPERAGLRDSVLINGTASHAIDYDDGHPMMIGHPAAAVIPALVALAIRHGVSGDDFLRGIIAGYEAAGRFGAMMTPDHYARGFHATGTVGAVAATLGGCWMLGLPTGAMATALGLAGTRAAGLKASFGTDGKPLHAGWAGLVGLTAILWAQTGMTGSADIIEHCQGMGAAMGTSFDGQRGLFATMEPQILATKFKQHAACGVTHPAIRAAASLRDRVGTSRIVAVRIHAGQAVDTICNHASPETGLALKFSIRGVVGMALLRMETANPDCYSDKTCADPALRGLIAASNVELHPELPIGPTRVEVDLADGRCLSASDDGNEILSYPDARAGLSAKFLSLAAPLLGRPAALALQQTILESPLTSISQLVEATAPTQVQRGS